VVEHLPKAAAGDAQGDAADQEDRERGAHPAVGHRLHHRDQGVKLGMGDQAGKGGEEDVGDQAQGIAGAGVFVDPVGLGVHVRRAERYIKEHEAAHLPP